ncbi:hypothetical protein [Bradyrhizobium sp. dw_78]|uniref:hypothetical protein n=1 Tax=Bradyrhizobium sp. dw_78 TaxID=2719793 RepID=UPI001BD277AC|nr:hypothetical protein [Bradyrhizobium sp. dw_78]
MIVRFAARLLLSVALIVPAGFANAQTAQQGPSQPSLAQSPGELTKNVRDELTSDKTFLDSIIALLKAGEPDQQTAIAQGLAQAAKTYAANNDPAFANQIQQAVAATGLTEIIKAYASIAGDTGTASTGGGGGTGGGGPNTAGAPTGGANNGGFNGGSNFAANGTPNLLTGGSLGGASFSSFTPTTFTPTSVSPQ